MPDLRSELQKLADLKFDDDGDTTVITLPAATAKEDQLGVSEKLFNIVKDNPGCTRSKIVEIADKAGIKMSSSSSLIVQFVKRGILKPLKNNGVSTYIVVGKEYKRGYIRRDKSKKVEPVAAVTPKPTTVPDNSLRVVETVPELLNALSIVQARELYDELKKIFGA